MSREEQRGKETREAENGARQNDERERENRDEEFSYLVFNICAVINIEGARVCTNRCRAANIIYLPFLRYHFFLF